ncbi:hypothetical protein BDZ97DRAFT_1168824 [Flammula alnicola]|nr:hypothetical protein BDZ97DRAFT_1168824 [Flammula alnicola]
MKFSIVTLAASLAFFSQTFAVSSPQIEPPIFQCTVESNILPCPPGYHCCSPGGPLTIPPRHGSRLPHLPCSINQASRGTQGLNLCAAYEEWSSSQ